MPFAFRVGDRLGNVVDVDQGLAHFRRARAKRLHRLRPHIHLLQAAAERLIDKVLEALVTFAAEPLQLRRHIIIDGQGRPHASQHKFVDVLMSRWCRGRPISLVAPLREEHRQIPGIADVDEQQDHQGAGE